MLRNLKPDFLAHKIWFQIFEHFHSWTLSCSEKNYCWETLLISTILGLQTRPLDGYSPLPCQESQTPSGCGRCWFSGCQWRLSSLLSHTYTLRRRRPLSTTADRPSDIK